jgi:hypothetical protein
VITPSRSRRSANPLSVKFQCKECGHLWYHELQRVDTTMGEWEDALAEQLALVEEWA